MKIIGICGGSGSGKSTVSACFKKLGGAVFDADAIYHELVDHPSPCVTALAEAFGEGILTEGRLNRDALREIVFSNEEKLRELNRISHSFVMEEIRRRMAAEMEKGTPFAVLDAPLLWEAGADEDCDLVVAVIADEEKRVERIMKRDGITEEAARRRISNQICDDELKIRCDAVLYNNGGMDELSEPCKEILNILGISDQK